MTDKVQGEIDGVVLALKPEFWRAIRDGRKTLEVRKNMPNEFQQLCKRDGFMRCYVCVTGRHGKVYGYFDCKQIIYSDKPSDILRAGETCLTSADISAYGVGRRGLLYGWRIENVQTYAAPLPLSVFGMERPPQSWSYCYL